jgi:hypothetical protein
MKTLLNIFLGYILAGIIPHLFVIIAWFLSGMSFDYAETVTSTDFIQSFMLYGVLVWWWMGYIFFDLIEESSY